MKRLGGLALAGMFAWLSGARQAHGQNGLDPIGPGEGGSVLKQPWDQDPPKPISPMPQATKTVPSGSAPYVQTPPESGGEKTSPPFANPLGEPAAYPIPSGAYSQEQPDPNQDILVTSEQGPWMICAYSYIGTEAPHQARAMAMELRNHHKTPTYIYNYGAEERRKELLRVKAILDQQKDFLKKNNLPLDTPLRVRHVRVQDQCAVLVGGYGNPDAARRDLDRIRQLLVDPKRVQLYEKIVLEYEEPKQGSEPGLLSGLFGPSSAPQEVKQGRGYHGYGRPFGQAFVCRNPTLKVEAPKDTNELDIKVLRRLNSAEPCSLLQCPKPLTLVIKQFHTPTTVEGKDSSKTIWDKLGFAQGDRVDAAARSAHDLAELLRKAKLDAYVLHTRFASIVTVGAYDGLEDPNLRNMRTLLSAAHFQDQLRIFDLFPEPVPMKVPR